MRVAGMSETPRTDATKYWGENMPRAAWVYADDMAAIERELNAARELIEMQHDLIEGIGGKDLRIVFLESDLKNFETKLGFLLDQWKLRQEFNFVKARAEMISELSKVLSSKTHTSDKP